jgi:methylenetetrahydrofolate dehydrogenase (NADP+)/methenyltetrahydrofolate cyclohydrolase
VSHLKVVEAIPPAKDAEGIHPANLGKLLITNHTSPLPCTATAAVRIILSAKPRLNGVNALVIGRSATVGKPLAMLLLAEHATVTIAHSNSDLRATMREAEVVVAATGAASSRWRAYEKNYRNWHLGEGERPPLPNLDHLVTMDMVRRGAVVIDVGENNIPVAFNAEGIPVLDDKGCPVMRHTGDVDFEKVKDVAGFITQPRGAVGPLTNAFLLLNVVSAALRMAGAAP